MGEKTTLARRLRRRATAAERRAWVLLRNRRMLGLKFKRQKVIRGFIVDFYCAELRLVLELDGSVHDDPAQRAYDREREAVLRGVGLTVVRLPNAAVRRSTLETILSDVLKSQVRVPPLPRPGEGDRG